jgi:hypothetical protein
VRVGRSLLRKEWEAARKNATIRGSAVVFLVKTRMPLGFAESGYFRPGAPNTFHAWLDPAIFRFVPPDVFNEHEDVHRIAVWAQIPRAPFALLPPLLRHELEHAAQWERGGSAFIDANSYLYEAWRVRSNRRRYFAMPSERQANLAAAVYARRVLSDADVASLVGKRAYRQMVDIDAPQLEADEQTLTLEALAAAGDAFMPGEPDAERERCLARLRVDITPVRDHPRRDEAGSHDVMVVKPWNIEAPTVTGVRAAA